jgi:hypothetical protein
VSVFQMQRLPINFYWSPPPPHPTNFTQNFRLMYCSISILVTILVEQHNTITLKQSSEVSQLIEKESSLV